MTEINESQKYPTDKEKYDKNYLRIFHGIEDNECEQCLGGGVFAGKECPTCSGSDRIEGTKE